MEIKKEIYRRVPPGDRWRELNVESDELFESLTDALEHHFQKTGVRQYYIDAAAGFIYKVDEVADPVLPPKEYSIYGDGY